MLPAPVFDEILRSIAESDVGAASEDESFSEDRRAEQLLREAYARLQTDPSLRSGDDDDYTFEDPVLAVAAYVTRLAPRLESELGHAAPNDENLTDLRLLSAESVYDYSKLLLKAVWAWYRRGNQAWEMLGQRVGTKPIVSAADPLRLAVVGDAGGRGTAQERVFRLITACQARAPLDWVIHLGDTYFGAGEAEMIYNLLNPISEFRTAGAQVATLCGNHDLYYGPQPYDAALNILGQPGRYFCLETPAWRVACLDTSLACERVQRNEGRLDDGQLAWLDGLLELQDGKRLVLLSHHYIISAWDARPSPALVEQLSERVRKRVFAWYWGHEHRCATFARVPHGFFGACVGNGVWLEPWSPPGFQAQGKFSYATWYPTDVRCTCYPGRPNNWPHGFLELELAGTTLTETYHLEDGSRWQRRLFDDAPPDARPVPVHPQPAPAGH